MTTITWLGLGAMGTRMARRLVHAGHDLTVCNRSPGGADALKAVGAHVGATPAEAVRNAKTVFVMLADPASLHMVTEGATGIAAGTGAGATVVDMSTVGPAAEGRLRAALPDEINLLDAPVLGSLTEADAGTLTLLVGGAAEAIAPVRQLLSILGDIIHLGPAGTGAAAKLIANFSLLGTVGVLGEVLALADGLGLPREVTWRVLAHTPLAAQADRRRPVVEADAYVPRFPLALARKDADLVVDAADAAGADVRLARATRSWLADAEAAGLGARDYTALLGHIPSSRNDPERTGSASPANSIDVPHRTGGTTTSHTGEQA
ncbi:NAD(P)-dependent oxidoreductase [Micromonospora sp. U56]|uniref:NAD(P)-dependent oxidoreductase n=1 Tax=Micromonospora sp. U56 TaxID=2824900 RepID=UPI001B3851A1|nr:NAD(P)-dependent oxidoreductase [Micromonospora sp. U56]MBQ0892678.1 NAD(P)-dependent oxidoreductase [Micromonospora sp. U56]